MCHLVGENFHLFTEAQAVGWLTRHSHREWGAGNGFFPIVTLSLLKSVTAMGGYGLLVKYAKNDIEQGIFEHFQVGFLSLYLLLCCKFNT